MEMELCAALKFDLNKTRYEAYFSEINLVKAELRLFQKKLRQWMKPRNVRPSLAQMPAKASIYPEPFGVVLIVSPWNYPVQLSLLPLIGAIAAGNTAIIKTSADTPATSAVLKKLVSNYLDERAYVVVEGGRAVFEALLEEEFDLIFFTGSTKVGQVVMEKAARFLTPVILELGGKSPAIIDETADLTLAVRRILFGKLINSGQTCVAPDYVLVPQDLKDALVEEFKRQHQSMIPTKSYATEHLPRIVNDKQFSRLKTFLDTSDILYGGEVDDSKRQFGFTLIEAPEDATVMQEEIFGPILPVVTYRDRSDVMMYLKQRPKPLALYLFSQDEAYQAQVLRELSFGGGCINDTLMHLANHHLPFGGVGASGLGAYHGYHSFQAFSHFKSVVTKSRLCDIRLRYHPFRWSEKKLPTILFR